MTSEPQMPCVSPVVAYIYTQGNMFPSEENIDSEVQYNNSTVIKQFQGL